MNKYDRFIDSIANHIINYDQLEPLLSAIAKEIQMALGVDAVCIYQEQDDNYSIAIAQSLATKKRITLPFVETTIRAYWSIPQYKQTISPIQKDYLAKYKLQALIIIPIKHHQSIWGSLRIYSSQFRLWRRAEKSFLQHLSLQIAIGLQKCQLCQPILESERLIHQLASSLVYLPSKNFFNVLVKSVVQILNVDYAYINLLKGDDLQQVEVLAGCYRGENVILPLTLDINNGPCQKVMKEEKPQVCHNSGKNIFLSHPLLKKLDVIIYLGVPLIDRAGKIIGTLCIMNKTDIDQFEYKQKMLEIFAIRVTAEIENRKNQKNLNNSEYRYRNLIETAPIAIFQTDPQGNCLYVNKNWRQVTDTTDSETLGLGLSWANIIHPDDVAMVSSNWFSSIKRQRIFRQELRFPLKDGSIRWVYAQAAPEYDLEGNLIGYVGTLIDITERKSAELALKDSEKLYRNLVETACEGIWMLDEQGNTTFTNPMMCEMLGYTAEEMLGKNFLDFIDDSDRGIGEKYFQNRTQGIKEQHDFKLRRRDGSILWTLISTNPIVDDDGKFIGALGMLTDISDRKQLEEAIQQIAEGVSARTGEIFFRSLVEYLATTLSMDCCCIVKISDDNAKCETLACYMDGTIQPNFEYDLEGSPCANVVLGEICYYPSHTYQLFPQDRVLVDLEIESYLGAPLFDSNNRCIGLLVVLNRQPISPNSLAIRILQIFATRAGAELERQKLNEDMEALIEDRTKKLALTVEQLHQQIEEKIQAEERYRNLIDTLPYGVQENDLEGTITYTNPAYDRIYGYELGEALNIKIWDKLVNHADTTLLKNYLNHIISQQPEPTPVHFTNTTKSGKLIDIQIDWTYKRNEQGKVVGFISIISDITERRQAEREIKRALLKERQLNQLKTQFIDTASHEFRTPLTIILGSIKFLLKRYTQLRADKVNELLLRIQSAGLEINDLIEDLLTLSRADANKINLLYKNINLCKFCQQLINNYQLVEEASHRYNLQLNKVPTFISSDEKLLKHILNNLLANARKYSPDNTNIDLKVEREGDSIIFQVIDRGIGIPPQDHPYIFDPFHRATNVENRSGTGLGLSITKKYVEILGGRITFNSELKVGSTFTVILPITSQF